MSRLTDICATLSLKDVIAIQQSESSDVYEVCHNGAKAILKITKSDRAKRTKCFEADFLSSTDSVPFSYLQIPKLIAHGADFILMSFVSRESHSRESILDRVWATEDYRVFVNGLREFQEIPISRGLYSHREVIQGTVFPIVAGLRIIPAVFRTFGTKGGIKVFFKILSYAILRPRLRYVTAHYDLQTYNCAFSTERNALSIIDFQIPLPCGDSLQDICYFVSIPPAKLEAWTFQRTLLQEFLQSQLNQAGIRRRIVLLVLLAQFQRWKYFRTLSRIDYERVYRQNIECLLSDGWPSLGLRAPARI
jgi:hypothetical protein